MTGSTSIVEDANLQEPDSKGHEPKVGDELDLDHIVRAELHFTPGLSGVAVPTMVMGEDGPEGANFVYQRSSDGTRRQVRLDDNRITLPDGQHLWLYPRPAQPSLGMARSLRGWSRESRASWLRGEATVSPAELFRWISKRISRFLVFPQEDRAGTVATLVCWILLTYCYVAWDAIPYLNVGGPKESGKTTIFEVLFQLVFRPHLSSNLTAAALYRTLHDEGGVFLLDEAERLKFDKTPDVQGLLSILLGGYKKGGSAPRMERRGDGSFESVSFDTYGPKAMACIRGLPDALNSRCVSVQMFRAQPGSEVIARSVRSPDEDAEWRRVRDALHVTALDHGHVWPELARRRDVCSSMSGRQQELWQPLLALGAWFEEEGVQGLLSLMQEHAQRSVSRATEDEIPAADEALLQALAEEITGGSRPRPSDILRIVRGRDPDMFERWSAKGVSECIGRYGVRTSKTGGQRVYSQVRLSHLQEIQVSYSIDLGLDDGVPSGDVPHAPHVPSNDVPFRF